jgi:hypothetical protein
MATDSAHSVRPDDHPDEDPKNAAADKARRRSRERRRRILFGALVTIVTGALATLVAQWLLSALGPQTAPPAAASTPPPIINPGHLPGRIDVSTMAPKHKFYAIPNFYYLASCGRPCWLPLYEQPTEQSKFVTDGWPCEYYGPNDSSEPSCVTPPARRTPDEMANPADKDSGDRLLVVCQLRQTSDGQALPTIHNQDGQGSNIWDEVAVPEADISSDSPLASGLTQLPGMPGFDEAFAPDIWLGNTGWHGIPCG